MFFDAIVVQGFVIMLQCFCAYPEVKVCNTNCWIHVPSAKLRCNFELQLPYRCFTGAAEIHVDRQCLLLLHEDLGVTHLWVNLKETLCASFFAATQS